MKCFRLSLTALRVVQIRTLLTYVVYGNVEFSSLNVRLSNRDKTCLGDCWLKLKCWRSRCWIYSTAVSESELKREAAAMFSKHKLQADADFKTTLFGSHLSALLWLVKRFYSGQWLVIFSHVKNSVREVDWTYRFFTCENIAHIEFYLQGLLPKILAIYTIKRQI